MKIVLASDHGGFELKNEIKKILEELEKTGVPVNEAGEKIDKIEDIGAYSEDSVDYPEYGRKCAEAVVSGQFDRGIVVCGTGIGISIAANKVHGARCALCTSVHMAEMTRRHNDANLLALGGRTTEAPLAVEIVKTWLATAFEGGRHQRRVDLLDQM